MPAATTDLTSHLRASLDGWRLANLAPGGLALVRVGGRTSFAASGTADLGGTRITSDTRFRIASITKPIVATLLLLAVERGDLSLDAVVGELLPGVLRTDPPVTVRQLLDHTSGIFDEGNEGDAIADLALLTDPLLLAEADDLLARAGAGERVIAPDRLIVALAEVHPRYFAPGTGYHYSNPNYQLAAMVLEHVSGLTLAELLERDIVGPLGLRRTSVAPPDLASPELRGYMPSVADGSLVDVTDDLVSFGNGGNGGIISNADDLLTMLQATVSGRLLQPPEVAAMTTPNLASYGLGIATYELRCGRYVGHGGGVNGTASIALVSPDGTSGFVAALNLRREADPRLEMLAETVLCAAT